MILIHFCSSKISPSTIISTKSSLRPLSGKGFKSNLMTKFNFKKLQPPFVSADPVMAEKPDFFYEDFANGATVIGKWQGKVKVSLRAAINWTIRDIYNHICGKRGIKFVPRNQVFPLPVFNCSLICFYKKFSVLDDFIHKNCFELFLSAYFLFL